MESYCVSIAVANFLVKKMQPWRLRFYYALNRAPSRIVCDVARLIAVFLSTLSVVSYNFENTTASKLVYVCLRGQPYIILAKRT